jgi:hypothetical protein
MAPLTHKRLWIKRLTADRFTERFPIMIYNNTRLTAATETVKDKLGNNPDFWMSKSRMR